MDLLNLSQKARSSRFTGNVIAVVCIALGGERVLMDDASIPVGKVPPILLQPLLKELRGFHRDEVLIGPQIGEDAAVIGWPAGAFLLATSDPIVGAVKGTGNLLVNVNANDIAAKGGDPAYMIVVIILPNTMALDDVASLMKEVDDEAKKLGVAIIGGHTEFSDRYNYPILVGTMLGIGHKVLRASSIRPDDLILLTKHVGLEGMVILANDREDLLASVLSSEEIAEVKNWASMLSVVPEARLLRDLASFMHDPTEGGVVGGISEIVSLTSLKVKLDFDAFPIHPITEKVSEALAFDPLHLISSGVLLAVLPPEKIDVAKNRLREQGIAYSIVGKFDDTGMGTSDLMTKEELWQLLSR